MKSRIFSTASFLAVAIAIIFTLNFSASAQETTGTIIGSVRDASGAIVPGATVTISDPQKNNLVVRSITTNESGEYSAPNLPAGVYTVTIEAANFKKSVNTDVKLDVGARRAVDVALEAGNVTETVTVEADQVAVNLTTPTAGTTINGDQVREIPINNRNFVQLVALAPGVSNDLSDQVYVGTTNPDGQANTINISVNGARSSQNTFTVDGADITDRGSNITIQAYPSVDSIGEFKVLRSLYPAESGRSGGGQVNIVTRSGGNKFSGSLFEFVRNDAFNANNFLINSASTPPFGREDNGLARRPPFNYNNYGWTLGGPVYFFNFGEGGSNQGMFRRWDKTFFFFSEEFRKDSRFTSAQTVSVPDAALRNGIFPVDVCINRSNVATENCNAGNPGRLAAGTPIPLSMYSPTALAYLNGIYRNLPLPNASALGPYALITALPNKADFQQEILKIDHQFNDNWSAYYRYQRDEIPTIDGNSLFSSGQGLPEVSTTSTNSPGRAQTLQTTYALGSNMIFEGRYTYSYGAILSENIGLLGLARTQVPVTLPFANQRDRNPSITNNGFTGLTSFGPYDNFSDKHNYTGSLTYIFGGHTTKYGIMYSMYRKNENALAGNNEGLFSAFSATVASGVTDNTTNQNLQRWANFLVGNVATFSQASFDYTADLRQKAFEAYAQDEWRIRPNLTIYFGVRYSFFGSPWDKNGRLSNFIPELFNRNNTPQVTGAGNRISGVTGVNTGNWCNGIIVNTQNFTNGPAQLNCSATLSPYGKYVIDVPKNDFAPRVGLAWDPFGKGTTSIRMGYGIYHEQVLNGTFLQNIGANVPYQQTANLTNVRLENPGGGATVTATVPNLRAVQSDWETPYMQHWSLDVQRQLFNNLILTIGYYGSKGTNLIGLTEINSLPVGLARNSMCAAGANYYGQSAALTLVQCQPDGYAFRNSANVIGNPNRTGAPCSTAAITVPGCNTDLLILDQLRPFKGYRSIAMVQPRYNSNYHSLQVSGQYRFSGASQMNVAYTWSKNLTDSQNDRTASPVNSYDIRAEWARAALDRRHIFNFNYVYELPFFRKQEGFVGKLFGGIQASGIVTYQSGLGFTAVTSNLDYAGLGIINANPSARPNVLCNPNQGGQQNLQQWFNTACFERNPTAAATGLQNTPGNAARNIIDGPSTFRIDFTLAKSIRFTEKISLQLRGEVYNILNYTNFRGFVGTPNSLNVTSANFGQIGSVRDPRTMQFGVKLNF